MFIIYLLIFILLSHLLVNTHETFYFSDPKFNIIVNKFNPWISRKNKLNISKTYPNIRVILLKNLDEYDIIYEKTITSFLTNNLLNKLNNKLYLSKILKNSDYYPKTFEYNEILKLPTDNELYFIKNVSKNTYGGKGIIPIRNFKNIDELLDDDSNYIIQKGIENPLLFNGYKGDIRILFLIIFYNNKLIFYLFNEGWIKTAQIKYDTNSINTAMQLTNVNQVGDSNFINNYPFTSNHKYYDKLFPKLKRIMKDVSIKIKNEMIDYDSDYILEYQLCGPDIIFDDNYNPYLLELNTIKPAFLKKTNSEGVKNMKINVRTILYNNLFLKAIKNEKIDIEDHGFIKLI